jgi:nucleoredoxin
LKGKKLGLYFSASWCGPCRHFTPSLVEAHKELSTKGDFEIIFISADKDEEWFNEYFSKMPWLAIPFSDSEKRDLLNEEFRVRGMPTLVIIGEDGKVVSDSGVEIIQEYGIEGYPFTEERIKELKDQEEAARRNQSLGSLLVTRSRDFVISPNGNRVTSEFQWCCLLYKKIRELEICYSSPLISIFVLNVQGACL